MANSWGSRLLDIVLRATGKALQQELRKSSRRSTRRSTTRRPTRTTQRTSTRRASERSAPRLRDDYPGDFTGRPTITYDPHPGTLPDPGEVVWTWVPYEEDHSQGKDRPVLLIGRDGDWLLALPLTSKDHDRDAAQEAAAGRHWIDVGSGSWDPRRRPSEARVDRIVRVNPTTVRRVGDKLDKSRFDQVADAVRRHR